MTGYDRHTIRDQLHKLETRKSVPRPPRASPQTTPINHKPPRSPPEPSTPEANKERGYVYKDDNGWHARCPYNTELHARYKWQENATKPHWWDNLLTIRLPLPIGNRKEIVPRILENLLPHRKKPASTHSMDWRPTWASGGIQSLGPLKRCGWPVSSLPNQSKVMAT